MLFGMVCSNGRTTSLVTEESVQWQERHFLGKEQRAFFKPLTLVYCYKVATRLKVIESPEVGKKIGDISSEVPERVLNNIFTFGLWQVQKTRCY